MGRGLVSARYGFGTEGKLAVSEWFGAAAPRGLLCRFVAVRLGELARVAHSALFDSRRRLQSTTVPAANVGTTTVPPSTTSTIPIDWACDNSGKRQDGSPCQVGDLSPAGGRVIHQTTVVLNAAGGVSDGGSYFELTPAGWNGAARDPSMALGCSQGSTKTDLGLGASLTKAMIDACPTGSGAVQAAAGLVITRNGQVFDDWFLPSRGEIIRITETKVPGLGLLMNSEYWSSSLKSWSSTGWQVSIRFEWPGGVAAEQSVTTTARVRPIRVFG